MQALRVVIALTLLVSPVARAQPVGSTTLAAAVPGEGEGEGQQGPLMSVHSGQCLGGAQRPAVEPCDRAGPLSMRWLPGQRGVFMVRQERSGRCLFSNRDGRFGWYTCVPGYTDQHWSWLPLPGASGGQRMLRAQHSGQCLYSNADGRFGVYACTANYSDQHWTLGMQRRQPPPPSAAAVTLLGTWYFADGAAIAVHDDGTFVLPNDGGGTWRPLPGGEFELFWGGGRADRVRVLPGGEALDGVSTWAGQTMRVTARRQPRAPTPNAPVPAPPSRGPGHDRYACDSDADCMIFCPRVAGCCGSACGCTHAMRRDQAAAYEAEYRRTCRRPPSCLVEGCMRKEAGAAVCQNGRCTATMMY